MMIKKQSENSLAGWPDRDRAGLEISVGANQAQKAVPGPNRAAGIASCRPYRVDSGRLDFEEVKTFWMTI